MKLNVAYIIQHEEKLWNAIRWGTDSNRHCKCGCENVYLLSDGRYKCKECGYIFSETSNTILQNSKLPKWKWLYAIYTLSAQRSISIRELSNMIGVTKKTAHNMMLKIRCYMSLDEVDLSGEVCMDEAHIGGWSGMHLKKKIEYMVENNYMQRGERYNKKAILAASSRKKQHILCGVNACGKAKIIHIKGQINKQIVKDVVKKNGITHIISDESPLYRDIKGVTIEQCNHGKHIYMTSSGHTSNPCENRFSWVKRILTAYHTHTSEKYLQLYLNQILFKMNNSNMAIADRFLKLGALCCKKYISQREVREFDYTIGYCYPVKDDVDWSEVVRKSGGLLTSVSDRKRVYS